MKNARDRSLTFFLHIIWTIILGKRGWRKNLFSKRILLRYIRTKKSRLAYCVLHLLDVLADVFGSVLAVFTEQLNYCRADDSAV